MSGLGPIRLGIIGLGAFGQARLLALRGIEGVEVVALCDRDQARLRSVAAEHSIHRLTTDTEELVRDSELDAVIVATPEDAHCEPVLAALSAGKHVLVEKPIALHAQEARRLQAAAAAAGRLLMPGHTVRFETRYALAKQSLDSGVLGTLVALSARRNRCAAAQQPYLRVHPVFETVIHDIDVALWFTQRRVNAVWGWQRHVRSAAVDAVWLTLAFEEGALATLESHWLLPDGAGLCADDALTVVGSSGVARVDLSTAGVALWTEGGAAMQNSAYAPRLRGTIYGAMREELQYFVSCVRNGVPTNLVPLAEAVHGIEVAEAAVQACATGAQVSLTAGT